MGSYSLRTGVRMMNMNIITSILQTSARWLVLVFAIGAFMHPDNWRDAISHHHIVTLILMGYVTAFWSIRAEEFVP